MESYVLEIIVDMANQEFDKGITRAPFGHKFD